MTKKVLFRADGGSTNGLGHLYRLFSLVEIVKDTFDFVFVTHETSTDSVIPRVYKKVIIPEIIKIEDEPTWLFNNFHVDEYIIVLDGYQFKAHYQKKLKNKGYYLIYIDDLAKEHMFADIVVNHAPHIKKEHYTKEIYTKLALGPKYALLRPLFLDAANTYRTVKTLNSAFVCFGGADPFDLTLIAVQALLNISHIEKIHIVLGGAYSHKKIIELEKIYSKIKIYRNLSEKKLIETIQGCDFAIVPASTILYEICCVKMPILGGFYVDNQKLIYKGLVDENIIFEGGEFSNYSISDFENKIKLILTNNKINTYIKNQYNLFDGNIKNRLLGLINELNISFRKCVENDMLRIFNWSNDELVRRNSYNSKPIQLENHKKWFFEKIKDKNTLFLIALVNNVPAGIVRYEKEEKRSIVGLLVSKEFRGQSLSSTFLRNSAKIYFQNFKAPIFAYVKRENIASIKAFENANYNYLKDDNIEGGVSLIYKLENTDVKK